VALFRGASILDIALGITMAIFGELLVPLGEAAPGIRLWWLVGGFMALCGAGLLIFVASLERRNRASPQADDDPVRR
jgi:hypothetical protein